MRAPHVLAPRNARLASVLALAVCLLDQAGRTQADEELTRVRLLEEAFVLAKTVSPLDQRALAVADVGLATVPVDREQAETVLAEAGFIATTIPGQFSRALAMQAVARRIAQVDGQQGWADRVFGEAVSLKEDIPAPGQVSLLLTQVALGRAASDPEAARGLLAEAAGQARLVPEVNARVAALRDVSSAYGELDPEAADALFGEALSTAEELPAGAERDLVLAELAGLIAQRDLQQAVEVTGTVNDVAARSQALRGIVLVIPVEEAAKARELALSIPDVPTRVVTVRDFALTVGRSAPDVVRAAVEHASEVAGALPDDDLGHEARADAAAAWAPLDVDRALTEAKAIADDYYGDLARRRIALFLADTDPDRALGVAEQIERSVLRSDPLCAVLAGVAKQDPKRAYQLVSDILSRQHRVEALLTIAAQLPPGSAAGGA